MTSATRRRDGHDSAGGARWKRLLILTIGVMTFLAAGHAAEALTPGRPEEVGLSAERLVRLTASLRAAVAQGRYPGAVCLIARKGWIAYFESVGARDDAKGAPMPRAAIFRIYSMTKPLTSAGAMILAEEGRLLLADPVSKYLPPLAGLRVAARKPGEEGASAYVLEPAEREMTIYDLLRHTSGFAYASRTPNAKVKEAYTALGIDWRGVTPAEQLERRQKAPLASQPGSAWEYSLSTDVLGRVIEAVSGKPLGQFLAERIFRPLGMADTGFFVPGAKLSRLAQPFPVDRVTGKPFTLLDVTSPPKNDAGGAGGVSTALDYAQFLQMLMNGGRLGGVRLLSRTTVQHMTADHLASIRLAAPLLPPGHGFGLGFAVRKDQGLHAIPGSAGEYGWGGGAGTAFWVSPKEQLLVVLMTQGLPGAACDADRE